MSSRRLGHGVAHDPRVETTPPVSGDLRPSQLVGRAERRVSNLLDRRASDGRTLRELVDHVGRGRAA